MAIYKRKDDNGAISNNPHNKYPWEVLIYMRLAKVGTYKSCPPGLSDDEDWNARDRLKEEQESGDTTYDFCTGSLITNKGSLKNLRTLN